VSMHALAQAIGAVSQRFNGQPPAIVLGSIVSYDAATNRAVAEVDWGTGFTYQTPPSQLMVPWNGADYTDQSGPQGGEQCVVACLDPYGDVFVILGYTTNDDAPGANVPSGERKIVDPRGSFVHWATERGGAVRTSAAGYATIFGGTGTEVGGENLDETNDAIMRKSDVDAALAAQIAQLKSDLTTWAAAHLQGGSGASGPTTLTAVESTGSTKARAAS